MQRLTVTLLTIAAGVCVLLGGTSVKAQPAGGVDDWARPLPDVSQPGVVVGTGDSTGLASGGGRSGGRRCSYQHDAALTAEAMDKLGFEDGAVYRYSCDDGDVGIRWIDAADPVDPAVLARQAARSLRLPTPGIGMNPPAGQDQHVNLKTWLWVEASSWAPQEATASVPGVSATVTATPTRVVWLMGDGGRVECESPGRRYDPARPAASQDTSCGYTYRHSSAGMPGGAFTVTATTHWDVSWTASGAPGGGELPAVARTATTTLRVAEVQALN